MNTIHATTRTKVCEREPGTWCWLGKRKVRIQRVVLHHPPAYRVYMCGATVGTLNASFVVDGMFLSDQRRLLPRMWRGPEQDTEHHDG